MSVALSKPVPTPSQIKFNRDRKAALARINAAQFNARIPAPVEPPPVIILEPIPDAMMVEAHQLIESNAVTRIKPGTIKAIQIAITKEFPVSLGDLFARRCTRSVVYPRQVGMYLAKVMTGNSLPEIGRRFGGRDHTTVLHAVRKIEAVVAKNSDAAAQVERIRSKAMEIMA